MGTEHDAYLRIETSRNAPEHYGDAPSGLVFVDLDVGAGDSPARLADQLRRAPAGFFNHAAAVLVRWPSAFTAFDESLALAGEQLALLAGSEVALGNVSFQLGTEPVVAWQTKPVDLEDDVLLARARAIELRALMEWGRALWMPQGYHYQLPSRLHTDAFIRVADAICTPRDATALATWLFPYVGPDLSVILDSRTLVPLVLALRAELQAQGADLGPVAVLDEYPETNLEYEALTARTGGGGTLAILSLSFSNRTRYGLASALEQQSGDAGWRLETLVSRAGEQAARYATTQDASRVGEAWLGLEVGKAFPAQDCEFCRSRDKRPYVQIDPHSFSALVLPDPPLVKMPDIRHDHSDLLEMYERADAIGLECAPPKRTELRRGKDLSAIRFYPHELLALPDFIPKATERLRLLVDTVNGDPHDGWSNPATIRGYDAVAVLDEDMGATGFAAFLQALPEVLDADPSVPVAAFSSDTHSGEADRDALPRDTLREASKILIVTMGAVTGGTMQELLWRVHAVKRDQPKASYRVTGLAVHARPVTFREWETLRNAYDFGLFALWVTYLPWRSTLGEEMRLLERLPGDEGGGYAATRQRFCKPMTSDWKRRKAAFEKYGGVDPHALFWGTDNYEHRKLLATSHFGHEVGPIAGLVGLGAAMQRTRLENRSKGAPPWLQFEMAGLGPSYFDTLLVVAALRWLEPYEGHWEAEGRDVEAVLNELWHRVDGVDAEQVILLAELLLAAAEGKLPRSAVSWLQLRVLEMEGRCSEEQMAPITLGRRLLSLAHEDALPPPEA